MKFPALRWQVPFDEPSRAEVEAALARDAYRTEQFLCATVLLMQVLMVCIFLFREGGPFLSPRRTAYVALYLLLIAVTLVFLLVRRRFRDRSGAVQLRVGAVYAGAICLWACCITILDQFGGNGLVVFSYMLPALAALTILDLRQSLVIFGGAFVLINLALPFLPGGMHNLFSNLVNSFALSTLSVLIARRLYCSRASAHYSNLIIRRQYEEIETANRRLGELAVTDQLTGLNNRRYLEETVRQRLESLRGGDRTVAGFMVDIDFFKQYNDEYGHVAGDRCLQAIAGEIGRFAAQGDIYAVRYGGEEFFLCWVGCTAREAEEAAEGLRLAAAECHRASGCAPVTISIGLCIRAPWGDTEFEDFLSRTDAALYRAKATGRDRVVTEM